MEYTWEIREGGIAIIYLKGRIIGEYQLVDLHDEISELMEQEVSNIIFDLSELDFMSSAGLSFFLKTLTRIRQIDGEVILVALNRLLKELLVTTKLTSFFVMEPTIQEALNYLKETGGVHMPD
jgi:anti-anti-sigma factor